jgi:hypothetical protein
MRRYRIYWLEEEFANHYFGRERMFYRLFLELKSERSQEMKSILQKQVQYITKSIPIFHIQQFIEMELKGMQGYQLTEKGHVIEVKDGSSYACLTVSDQSINLIGTGRYEAEMLFFDVLRKWDSRFLAIDFEQARYGWLSPIKQRKFV